MERAAVIGLPDDGRHGTSATVDAERAVIIVGGGGKISAASVEAGQVLGRPPRCLIGLQLEDLVIDEDVAGVVDLLDVTPAFGAGTGSESARQLLRVKRSGGVISELEMTVAGVEGPEHDQMVVLLAGRDSGHRPTDTSSRPAAVELAELVGHELRNPLTAITMFAELVLDRHRDVLDAEARSHLEHIVGAADQMRGSIDGVASLFRDEPELASSTVDTAELVRDAVDRVSSLVDGELEADIGRLPSVRGRPAQLRLVFENLLSNAVKYRDPARPLHVRVRALSGSRHVRFSVADNGIGIPPKDRRRVFELGYRAASNGPAQGTGVGLALCKRVIRRHGGVIWVDCAVPLGTRICFTLPT